STIAKWEDVLAGMQGGSLAIGSRTPTDAPAWVTLDVVTGGFATGGYAAGGPLRVHETALAARLGIPATRLALNLHFLTSTDADALLKSGCYRIEVPEEGALLVVAWLRQRGEFDRADALVEKLSPWLETLRFYPVPAERAVEVKETVRLQELATTLKGIDVIRRQRRFEVMREATLLWKPLRERAIALFAETVSSGRGLPGTTFPPGWHARVDSLVSELKDAGKAVSRRAREASSLIEMLARCAKDPRSLPEAEYRRVRNILTRSISANGQPGTPEHDARIAREVKSVSAPLHADLRRVLVERLRALPQGGGVELERAIAPVDSDEAARFGVPVGATLPKYFEHKVARSWDSSLEDLLERGVIASGEVLARVLPQVTSLLRAQTIEDPLARSLYVALYTAFRRRRGLLLVNYQHQVRFQELPWVAELEAKRAASSEAIGRARKAVANASALGLRAFPYTIVPNKLVTELYSFTNAADLKLPLVEELAADIFMGSFTAKFVEAAKISARLLSGSLYQRYYAIDPDEIARLPVPEGKPSPELAALCERRAGTSGSSVARNGKIIEQAQILTTHNLGVFFDALPLRDQLAPHMVAIAQTCFTWSTRRLLLRTSNWHQFLINLKNAAYAWRQMMFYLSFVEDLPAFSSWGRSRLERADESFRRRFEPAMRGLELAASGVRSNEAAFASGGGRVFTGWSTDRHWLAPEPAKKA
ncbi:MAG TPA: hypothetical protein VIV58_38580, partial [Kofleriaceae bacterium]